MDSQRYSEAQEALLALEGELETDADAQLMLAEVYFRQGRAGAALPHARKSIALRPQHPRAHFLLAELLDDLGRPGEMVAPLKGVLALQPEDYPTHLNLSYAYSEAGQPEEARREANWCLARNPKDVAALRLLAKSARDLGEHEAARKEIERALALAPEDLPSRMIEAELLLFERQPEQALQRLQPLYERYGTDRRLVALLAQAAAAAGRTDDADRYRRQVQKLSE